LSEALSNLGRVEDALRRCVAEFIGAFTLIFAGAGSLIILAGVPSLGWSASPSPTAWR
jgi:glycerol uptake facilitator-like aquaporin